MAKRTILVFALFMLASCASFPITDGKEPRTIVIRNRSGADINSVTLREAGRSSRGARFGTIAPVPQGVSQQVGRPSDPPPLSGTIAVEWIDNAGRTLVREVSVSKALKDTAGGKERSIVFEIGPFEDVLVFIEPDPK